MGSQGQTDIDCHHRNPNLVPVLAVHDQHVFHGSKLVSKSSEVNGVKVKVLKGDYRYRIVDMNFGKGEIKLYCKYFDKSTAYNLKTITIIRQATGEFIRETKV